MATAGDWGLAELGSLPSSAGNICNLGASEKSTAHTLEGTREVHVGHEGDSPRQRWEARAELCTGKGKGFLHRSALGLLSLNSGQVKIIIFSRLSSARWSDSTLTCRGSQLLFISRILLTQFSAAALLGWKNQMGNWCGCFAAHSQILPWRCFQGYAGALPKPALGLEQH